MTTDPDKQYLGDAVYVEMESNGIKITTEDGFRSTNTIHLEWGVFDALLRYAAVHIPPEDQRR